MAPPKEAFHPEQFVWKYADPRKTYKGNVNHWSIMRVAAEERVAVERLKDQKKAGEAPRPPPPPGPQPAPFLWSRDRILAERASQPFPEVVLQGMVGTLCGDLSKDQHKLYNKDAIRWPANRWRKSMFDRGVKEPYWYEDPQYNLSQHPLKKGIKLPVWFFSKVGR